MIPLLGLLLSIYLVFKGAEIAQIGFSSARPDPSGVRLFGVLCFAASILTGILFGYLFLMSGVAATNIPGVTK